MTSDFLLRTLATFAAFARGSAKSAKHAKKSFFLTSETRATPGTSEATGTFGTLKRLDNWIERNPWNICNDFQLDVNPLYSEA